MATITLTDNISLTIDASSADSDATLNRYLRHPLVFLTKGGWEAIAGKHVNELSASSFPLTASISGAGQFNVKNSALGIQAGASATVGLLEGQTKAAFLDSLELADDASAAFISFSLSGSINAGPDIQVGDFGFGVSAGSTLSLSSFCKLSGAETFREALRGAVSALTIPRDIDDLRSLPAQCICRVDASGSLQFSASLTYDLLCQPLATWNTLDKLPPISIDAHASATVETTATHTSDHTITIAKQDNGHVRLSVSLTRIDDLEASLTLSAGITAGADGFDGIAFLLDKISPNGRAEALKLQQDLPPQQAAALGLQMKNALNTALCSALQVSLRAGVDKSRTRNQLFLYDINLDALDDTSKPALQLALAGDFRTLTAPGKQFNGITRVDSVLTHVAVTTHTLVIHLLGIFNWQDTNTFLKQVTVGLTNDTHELVLSDEKIKVVTSSLDSEKLRQVVLKGVTLTLPLTANSPEAATPISSVFFQRLGSADPVQMRQIANELSRVASPLASRASALLEQNLNHYGSCSLYLGLDLTPRQCKQLFVTGAGAAYDWTYYLSHACTAAAAILSGCVNQNAVRLRLFTAGVDFWKKLKDAASLNEQTPLLISHGIASSADQVRPLYTDIVTFIWWSDAMAVYSQALAKNQSLVKAGEGVVKSSANGFDQPWLILALAEMLQPKPAFTSVFTSALLPPAVSAAQKA